MSNVHAAALQCLDDMGIYTGNLPEDFDLREYLTDSIQFISYILALEDVFHCEIPDHLLVYEKMSSFQAYCRSIEEFLNEQAVNPT